MLDLEKQMWLLAYLWGDWDVCRIRRDVEASALISSLQILLFRWFVDWSRLLTTYVRGSFLLK